MPVNKGSKLKINLDDLPLWFWTLIEKEKVKSDFHFNKTYNVYKCGICVIKTDLDLNRKKRIQTFYYGPDHPDNPSPGKKKKIHRTACACEKKSLFLYKFKVCECGKQIYGFRIKDGLCPECMKIKNNKKGVQFFQNGKEIKPPKTKLINYPDCVNRSECLSFTFDKAYDNIFLHCGGCKNYAKEF